MFEEIINEIVKFGGQVISGLQVVNSWILQNFGGILVLVAALAALSAWRKVAKANRSNDAMQRLADAIIRHYNKEVREK